MDSGGRITLILILLFTLIVLDISPLLANPQGVVLTAGSLTLSLSREGEVTLVSVDGNYLRLLNESLILYEGKLVNTQNLLSNPGFERLSGKVPTSWRFEHWGGEDSVIEISEVSKSGRYSVKISQRGRGKSHALMYGSHLNLRPGTVCKIQAWIKKEGIVGYSPFSAALRVEGHDERGKLWQYVVDLGGNGSADWRKYLKYFFIPRGTKEVLVYANIWDGEGSLWIDDVELRCTEIEWVPRKASLNSGGFYDGHVKVRFEGKGEWISISVKGRTSSPLSFCLPLDLRGWKWWEVDSYELVRPDSYLWSAGDPEILNPISPYGTSIYPLISLTRDELGIALGIDPRSVGIYRLAYSGERGVCLEMLHHGEINVTLSLFSFDGREGMRGALDKFFSIFDEVYGSYPSSGGIVADSWYLPLDTMASLRGLEFKYLLTPNRDHVNFYRKLGYLSMGYTEPWGIWVDFTGMGRPLDPLKKVLRDAEEGGRNRLGGPEAGWYNVPVEDKRYVARAVLNSLILDDSLSYLNSYVYGCEYCWHKWHWWTGERWQQLLPLNPLPSVPPPNRWNLTSEEIRESLKVGYDGISIDSIILYVDRLNFRKEHVKAGPKSFEPGTGKEVQPYQTVIALTLRELRKKDVFLGGNVFPFTPLLVSHPYLDFIYREAWCPHTFYDERSLNQFMVLLRNRPKSYLDYNLMDPNLDADVKARCIEKLLLHGIYPGIAAGDQKALPSAMALLSKYGKVLKSLRSKRWEPINDLKVTASNSVRVEKFSDPISDLYIFYSEEGRLNVRIYVEKGVVDPLVGSISSAGGVISLSSKSRFAAVEIYDNSSYALVKPSLSLNGSRLCIRVEAPESSLLHFRYRGQNLDTGWTTEREFCMTSPEGGWNLSVDVKIGKLDPVTYSFQSPSDGKSNELITGTRGGGSTQVAESKPWQAKGTTQEESTTGESLTVREVSEGNVDWSYGLLILAAIFLLITFSKILVDRAKSRRNHSLNGNP